MPTVGMVSLGCAKNRVDGELMLGRLKDKGYELVSDPAQAEVILVNTCGFIEEAKQESIDAIFEMAEHKKDRCRALIVTGCLSQRYPGEIRAELTSSAEAISSVTGKDVTLFRPPYGDYDDLLVDTAADMGMLTVQWDVDSLDWKDLSAQEIAERILAQTKSGSIILCHNNGLHTAEALPIVLDALKARGFEFVPIGELVYRENFTIDRTGRQFSNGG